MKTIILTFFIAATAITMAAQTPSPTPLDAAAEKQRADRLQARYNDFANLARYRDANSKLAAARRGRAACRLYGRFDHGHLEV